VKKVLSGGQRQRLTPDLLPEKQTRETRRRKRKMMDIRTLRKEMNALFSRVERLQRSLTGFDRPAREMKTGKKKGLKKAESQSSTAK